MIRTEIEMVPATLDVSTTQLNVSRTLLDKPRTWIDVFPTLVGTIRIPA